MFEEEEKYTLKKREKKHPSTHLVHVDGLLRFGANRDVSLESRRRRRLSRSVRMQRHRVHFRRVLHFSSGSGKHFFMMMMI